ncbi:hypothetical protein CB1_000239009 [Camelus ferus]|nr:hypothetical protein CB1_000239009 [Camelus ferus]
MRESPTSGPFLSRWSLELRLYYVGTSLVTQTGMLALGANPGLGWISLNWTCLSVADAQVVTIRFQVDLQCGSSVKPRADVAFHFNPRFKRANCIVCNTLRNEKWGWEEITYDMPFKKEESFEIVIMVLKEKFQVAVNGRHILLYAHRIPLDKVDTLGIRGQVTIRSVGFCFSPMIIYCDVRDFKVAVNGAHSLEYKHRFKELGDVDTLEVDGDICLLEVRSW